MAAQTKPPAHPDTGVDLSVRLGRLKLHNPITLASGCCGYAAEMSPFFDLDLLGGYSLKGIFRDVRPGNPPPRFVETPSGMINSIGLEGVGAERFVKEKLPPLKGMKSAVLANISGNTVEEYAELAARLSRRDAARVDALEINLSCPNIKTGGVLFGIDVNMIKAVVSAVKAETHKPVFTKLTPNITKIETIAEAAIEGGSDGLSLINTFRATFLQPETGLPGVHTLVGGHSGPAIRPLAVRMVMETHKAFPGTPILAMGGIACLGDVLEFFRAGAAAVAVGTAAFVDPMLGPKLVQGLQRTVQNGGFSDLKELKNALLAGEKVRLSEIDRGYPRP